MGSPFAQLVTKHDSFIAVEQNAVFQMVANRARKHASLDVATLTRESFGGIGVAYGLRVLHNDRTLVEIFGYVVSSCAYHFHASVKRLAVGLGALESRQKRMVDIDAATGEKFAHIHRKDLHIARQYDQVGSRLFYDTLNLLLLLRLIILADRQIVKRYYLWQCYFQY